MNFTEGISLEQAIILNNKDNTFKKFLIELDLANLMIINKLIYFVLFLKGKINKYNLKINITENWLKQITQ